MITELADALLEHYRDGKLNSEINFLTDEERDDTGSRNKPWILFIAACNLTGDQKYLEPVPAGYFTRREFNAEKLAGDYRNEITNLGVREYINTDGRISGNQVTVRVHSLGAVAVPETTLEVRDANGIAVGTAGIPALEAPLDLKLRRIDVKLIVAGGIDLSSGSVQLDPDLKIKQITRRNDIVTW